MESYRYRRGRGVFGKIDGGVGRAVLELLAHTAFATLHDRRSGCPKP